MKQIDTSRQAFTELRKLGFKKSQLQMTRGATTYTEDGDMGGDLTVTLAQHGAFIILDRRPEGRWSLIRQAKIAFLGGAL